ncbi:MAG: FeoB-associated Cys-rich membrane protein [Clostridiales bacterium]|jgi:1-aminocyclopropane-1-carboxylate deaminase/D-cysteine desulfhydrase-like pyridoxal-dependent ACC family enzyme|nr:FeoB-associated Cys-rich membrane protein [Clostridiales bacterium]
MNVFLFENFGTILVGVITAGIVASIVTKLVKDKQKGKCIGCDCARESCDFACHTK